MKNKKGEAAGESLLMIYRFVLISLIGLVVFGISGVMYAHNVDVKEVEAGILATKIGKCFVENGIVDLSTIDVKYKENILGYCGLGRDLSRFYVKLRFYEPVYNSAGVWSSTNIFSNFEFGDESIKWVKDLTFSQEQYVGTKNYVPNPVYESGIAVSDDADKIDKGIKIIGKNYVLFVQEFNIVFKEGARKASNGILNVEVFMYDSE